jgi:hypothetical protein
MLLGMCVGHHGMAGHLLRSRQLQAANLQSLHQQQSFDGHKLHWMLESGLESR